MLVHISLQNSEAHFWRKSITLASLLLKSGRHTDSLRAHQNAGRCESRCRGLFIVTSHRSSPPATGEHHGSGGIRTHKYNTSKPQQESSGASLCVCGSICSSFQCRFIDYLAGRGSPRDCLQKGELLIRRKSVE